MSEPTRTWAAWRQLLADESLPAAIVDLDAVDRNLEVLLGHMDGTTPTLRVASKSIRVPALMRHVMTRGGARMRGLMTYSAAETALLADEGFDDLLLAYPIGTPSDAGTMARLAADGRKVWATIDHIDHVDLLSSAAVEAGATLHVCLDIDMSLRMLGGRVHFGVRRSPLRDAAAALAVARAAAAAPGLEVTAVLAYEAQVAGIRERNPGSRHLDPVRRAIKARSRPLAVARRAEVLDALRQDGFEIAVVNGGGTGSVASTSRDPSVTEVTAGSGFLCSHLFDHYAGLPLEPAAFFALAVVRVSDPGFVTCGGGGYVASGSSGADRLPVVHSPAGLVPVELEGFGEVQTPLEVASSAISPSIGDPILCRHAKAGELAERFREILLVRGAAIVDRVPTYRGLGGCFL